MNNELQTKRAFTLIEIVAAVAILAMMVSFSSMIFNAGIGTYRTSAANAEIMQKLRAITDQLNADFKGLRKDGYLILRHEVKDRKEYEDSLQQQSFRADKLYYFTTGDFQSWLSWFGPNVRSNMAKVYFGHDDISLNPDIEVSKWNLVRDVVLITPGQPTTIDCNNLSFAQFKANVFDTIIDANSLFDNLIDVLQDPDSLRSLMCQNVGEIRIEWTDGSKTNYELVWWGLGKPIDDVKPDVATAIGENEVNGTSYKALWIPANRAYWPKALKFTFKLYDSKRILKNGRTFTHIVYIGD